MSDNENTITDAVGVKPKSRTSNHAKWLQKLSEELGREVTSNEKDDVNKPLQLLDLDDVATLEEFWPPRVVSCLLTRFWLFCSRQTLAKSWNGVWLILWI